MTDPELAMFLALAAPRLGLRAAGFRRVRATLRKRLARRSRELGLDMASYTRYLEAHPDEWEWLDACCRITISRFGRDAPVFAELVARVLPERAAAARAEGREELVRHITGFQQRMPDARFELASAAEGYAAVFRFDWRLHAGGKALDGTDFGTLADDGRIASITGFFGPRS